MSGAGPVHLSLSRDEALVLHEFLARAVDEESAAGLSEVVEDDAEVWALNGLLILLEQALEEPYAPGFPKLLAAARRRIVEASGPWSYEGADEAP